MKFIRSLAIGIGLIFIAPGAAKAAQTNVAVAANFTEAAKEIAAAFRQKTGHEGRAELRRQRAVLYPDHARRAVPGVPVGRRFAAEKTRRGRPGGARQPLYLCHRQAGALEQVTRCRKRRGDAEGRLLRKTVDLQSRGCALWRGGGRGDEGAETL